MAKHGLFYPRNFPVGNVISRDLAWFIMSKYHLIGHCEIVLTLMGWLLEDDVNFNLILISEIGNV